MRHDAAIPPELHSGAGASVAEALGSFWSTVFRDQELVDALVSARVLSACQSYIDAMEALSLRDHEGMPTFHREHWHPLLVRLSERNTGCGLVIGMEGDPHLGPQRAPGTIFKTDEVFVVGGNAEFSKVNTYPLDPATRGGLVSVGTCICDSIAGPRHVLVPGRDFELRGDVLLVRKEHDPFESGGYRVFGDGDDSIAVMWLCDSEFDRDHVGDFLGYPLGFDVRSTPESARMLSAMWDAVVYGLTPLHLNRLLGALFGIPVLARDSVVEGVSTDGGVDTVVTDDAVYQVPSAVRAACAVAGARLSAGTFLTDEIAVYHGLSKDEVASLVDGGRLTSLVLPAGSVAGVGVDVELANTSSSLETGSSGQYEWFRLSDRDSIESPFWTAVFSRTTPEERTALCAALGGSGNAVNPLRALGYLALANTVLVYTTKDPLPGMCSEYALEVLRRLMPPAGSVQVIRTETIAGASSAGPAEAMASAAAPDTAWSAAAVAMSDDVRVELLASAAADSRMEAARDCVALRFIPDPATEV